MWILLGFNCLEFEAIRIKRLVFEHFHDVTKMIGRDDKSETIEAQIEEWNSKRAFFTIVDMITATMRFISVCSILIRNVHL